MDHRQPDGPLQVEMDSPLLVHLHVFTQLFSPIRVLHDAFHAVLAPPVVTLHATDRLHQFAGLWVVRRHRRPHRIDVVCVTTARIDFHRKFVDAPAGVSRLLFDQSGRILVGLLVVVGTLAAEPDDGGQENSSRDPTAI